MRSMVLDYLACGIDKLIADSPYYAAATIPVAFYPQAQNDSDVKTFGVKATLVTSAQVADEVVYAIAKEVFDNFDVITSYSIHYTKLYEATNVAETSITIPGIKYVVDSGLARIARYLPRSRTTSLPVVPISRSSADQRKGRCGRLQDGICVRLFTEDDYLSYNFV